jgi:hypothetical protein
VDQSVNVPAIHGGKAGQPLTIIILAGVVRMIASIDDRALMVEIPEIPAHKRSVCFVRRE